MSKIVTSFDHAISFFSFLILLFFLPRFYSFLFLVSFLMFFYYFCFFFSIFLILDYFEIVIKIRKIVVKMKQMKTFF